MQLRIMRGVGQVAKVKGRWKITGVIQELGVASLVKGGNSLRSLL